jgi:lysophospholipase L1-like esterase
MQTTAHRRILGCLALLIVATSVAADDFAIRDGDTVAFLGDSITAARSYGKLIENYTLLRFPERRVHFLNIGKGGETASVAVKRLQRDVFDNQVTLLTVAYGVNDIGWGTKADAEHKQAYLDAIVDIVKQCQANGVRVYICSAAATGADPDKSETDFLKTMCDEGMKLARENGGQSIDVQGVMRQMQRRMKEANAKENDAAKKHSLHVADGVHLNDLGQVAMAYAILKGLGAPADVSSVEIDAKSAKVAHSSGCTVSDVSGDETRLEFTRLDEGLPLNGETFFALHFRFVPIPEELNRYMLTVTSLPPGKYEVAADDRVVGSYSAEQLAKGVNLCSATPDPWLPGGPWSAQANILHSLTESRDKLDMARMLARYHLDGRDVPKELMPEARQANAEMEEMQRLVARPRLYRFVVRPAAADGASSGGK